MHQAAGRRVSLVMARAETESFNLYTLAVSYLFTIAMSSPANCLLYKYNNRNDNNKNTERINKRKWVDFTGA